jgi:hypothetical protein
MLLKSKKFIGTRQMAIISYMQHWRGYLGCPGLAACGDIFWDNFVATLDWFAKNLVTYAFQAEIVGVMLAMEIANRKGWNLLWIETGSTLVTLAYRNHFIDFTNIFCSTSLFFSLPDFSFHIYVSQIWNFQPHTCYTTISPSNMSQY